MEKIFDTIEEKINTEEADKWIEVIGFGHDLLKQTRRRVFTRGFAMGITTAVAIQSVITIIVLLSN